MLDALPVYGYRTLRDLVVLGASMAAFGAGAIRIVAGGYELAV